MSGDALTAGRSAKAELTLQVFEVDDECVRLRPRELHQELSAAQTSDVSGLLLRQLSSLVPMDRCRDPKLTSELLGRAPESGEDIVRKLQRDGRHRSRPAPIMRRFPASRRAIATTSAGFVCPLTIASNRRPQASSALSRTRVTSPPRRPLASIRGNRSSP